MRIEINVALLGQARGELQSARAFAAVGRPRRSAWALLATTRLNRTNRVFQQYSPQGYFPPFQNQTGGSGRIRLAVERHIPYYDGFPRDFTMESVENVEFFFHYVIAVASQDHY